MNTKLFVSGVALTLLAVSMTASAHDIVSPGGVSNTYDSLTSLSLPVGEPCTDTTLGPLLDSTILLLVNTLPSPLGGAGGVIDTLFGPQPYGCLFAPPLEPNQTLFALTLCESDNFLGSGIETPGHGGFCSMSTGWTQGAGVCTFAGQSNGVEADYDGDGTCGGFAWPPAASSWFTFELTDSNSVPEDVAYQVGGTTCSFDGQFGVVDMQYAMFVDGGHLTAFQNVAGETGSYNVAASTAADLAAAQDCAIGFVPLDYF